MLILTFNGCSVISEEQALHAFKKVYPYAIVLEQFVGEGDSDTAYMHFRYTISGSNEIHEVMWVYQKQSDRSWKVIRKSKSKPTGSDFGD